MRIVTVSGMVKCEDVDFYMEHGEPVFLESPSDGELVQLWDWSNPLVRYERWVVSEGKLTPMSDRDVDVVCECSVCHYRKPATPGEACVLQGMKGPCKGLMNPIEE